MGEDRGHGVRKGLPSCAGASELNRERRHVLEPLRNKPHTLIPSWQSIESKLVFHTNTYCVREYYVNVTHCNLM